MVRSQHLACCFLLLVLACIPAANAGGMAKFYVSPIADPTVGDSVTATIHNDNNLAPKAGEVVLMLDWNPEVMRFVSATVEQGHTTAADPIGTHNLEIRAADTVNGLPNGDEALATVTFRIVGPGYTPIVVDIQSVRDVSGADIRSRAVSSNGAVTATGTAAPTTAATTAPTTATTATTAVPVVTGTLVPTANVTTMVTATGVTVPPVTTVTTSVTTAATTGITTGITVVPTQSLTPSGSGGAVNQDTDDYTGVVTRTPTPTAARTETRTPTPTPTPAVTANLTASATPTAVPTATSTLVATPTANATTSRAPVTPTATKSGPALALAAIGALGVAFLAARRR